MLHIYVCILTHIVALSIFIVFQPHTQCISFCDAVDNRKSDHFSMNNFALASGIHHDS